MRRLTAVVLALSCCLLSFGCADNSKAQEEQKMKDALEGKNVGEMPPEIKAKMEAAMKKNAAPSPGQAK